MASYKLQRSRWNKATRILSAPGNSMYPAVLPRKAPPSGGTEYTRTVGDGMQFIDPVSKEREHLLRDFSLFAEQLARAEEHLLFDTLLGTDATQRETSRNLLSAFMLDDTRASVLERLLHEDLFFLDSAAADAGRGVVVALMDGLLFEDYLTRVTEKTVLDHALLLDIQQAMRNLEQLIRDEVLLTDERTGVLDRLLLDSVLAPDAMSQTLLRVIAMLDGVLLFDAGTALRDILERQILDGLLFAESLARSEEKLVADSSLFADSDFREQLKTLFDYLILSDGLVLEKGAIERLAADGMLFVDAYRSARELSITEELLFYSVLQKLRELVLREDITLFDSAAALKLGTILEFTTWVRLKSQDQLGIRIYSRDPLGIKIDVSQWEMQA